MDKQQETLQTWNKVAKLYEQNFMNLDIYNESYNYFSDLIYKPNALLLDIGCGPGNITRYLLNRNPGLDVTGIDMAENMIELARKNNPEANFLLMNANDLASININFDAAIAGFCIPYLSTEETQAFVGNVASLMNLDGLFYLSFVAGNPSTSGFLTASTGDRTYFYYHEVGDIVAVLENNNFSILKTFHVSYKTRTGQNEIHTVLVSKFCA